MARKGLVFEQTNHRLLAHRYSSMFQVAVRKRDKNSEVGRETHNGFLLNKEQAAELGQALIAWSES